MKLHELPANVWEDYRHWSPKSESYSGCDSLISALDNGWELRRTLTIHRHAQCSCYSLTFRVLLQRDGQLAEMRIIDNPTIRHLLKKLGLLPLQRPGTVIETQEMVAAPVEEMQVVVAG
jgi:hypothetical protein